MVAVVPSVKLHEALAKAGVRNQLFTAQINVGPHSRKIIRRCFSYQRDHEIQGDKVLAD